MFRSWYHFTFAGWLLKKQLLILASLSIFIVRTLTRLFRRGIRTIGEPSKKHVLSESAERERMAGCRTVVLEFANTFGTIAREAITRKELEELIDKGISPEDLTATIYGRIQDMPGLILGTIPAGQGNIPIKLPDSLRDRHCYIIGRSGSGKTNIIRLMLQQDIEFGNGVGVLAPEQELITDEILPYMPQDRIDDVVYVDPSNTTYPIPLNPVYLQPDSDIDLCVDDNLTIFKRLMGDTQHRMDEILRQTLYALLERPNSTLLDVERLLSRTDDTFRKEVIRTTKDEQTRYFFESTYPAFPKDAHLPITTRINRLVRPKTVRTLLCQPGKSFNFRKAMDEGKILLFNLSDGILGEQTAQLLGQLIVSKIQLAAMSRANIPKHERREFFLYLDEFQTFTGVAETSYSAMLSRARKYKLGLILAHQQTGQLPKKLLEEIFGNVTTFITFSVAYADAQRLGQQYIFESQPLPPAHFVNQKVGEAMGKIGQTVFPLVTPLAPQQANKRRAEYIMERSARNYGLGTMWEAEVKRPKQKPPIQLPPPQSDKNEKRDDEPPIMHLLT
jgi:hypothetical protein